MARDKGMPKWCFKRKESPFIWYKFKVNGRIYTKSTETADRKLAESIVGRARSEAVEGKIRPVPVKMGIKDLILMVLNIKKVSPEYRRSTLNVVESPIMKDKKCPGVPNEGVCFDDVQKYHEWRIANATESTVNRELGYFQSCINYARKKLKMNIEDPVSEWARWDERQAARDRVLSFEERAKLLADPKFSQQAKDIMVWAYKTGMRKGEIRAAKWSHIDWSTRKIKVRTEKKKRRGGQSEIYRFVPLHIYALEILKRRRMEGWEKKSAYIFCDEKGGQLTKDGQITTAFEYACQRNKIHDMRFHDLRHTFATDFLRANKDIKSLKALSEIMGHSEEGITRRYTHIFEHDKDNSIALLPAEPGFMMAENSHISSYAGATRIVVSEANSTGTR